MLIIFSKKLKMFFGIFKDFMEVIEWRRRRGIQEDEIIEVELNLKEHYCNILYFHDAKETILEKNMSELTLVDEKSNKSI